MRLKGERKKDRKSKGVVFLTVRKKKKKRKKKES